MPYTPYDLPQIAFVESKGYTTSSARVWYDDVSSASFNPNMTKTTLLRLIVSPEYGEISRRKKKKKHAT